MDRRSALRTLTGLGIGTAVFHRTLAAAAEEKTIDRAAIAQAEWIAGIELTDEQRDAVAAAVGNREANRKAIAALTFGPEVSPAFVFQVAAEPITAKVAIERNATVIDVSIQARPASDDDLAFLSVAELGVLLRLKAITSVELTRLCLDRLKKFDPQLHCVVTLCEATAMEQAAQADAELAAGTDKGALHGIPWGAKDLIAVPGYPTTWGAPQFKSQQFDSIATVASRLAEAGAVLVAKLSLGALAMGDQWFGGTTRSPWDTSQGSSGSSAGSACAVAAGLVPFAIGSETLGSIVSPSRRCGVVGLRPTFGRVSRAGCMPLSWTMDKIGPIVRFAQDAALVLDAIHGADQIDRAAVDRPFHWPIEVDISKLTLGVVTRPRRNSEGNDDEPVDLLSQSRVATMLSELGATIVPLQLPDSLPVWAMVHLLEVESAAMFHELTDRSDDEGLNAWGGIFRAARFTSAVEYVQMMRARTLLQSQMNETLKPVDMYLSQNDLGHTNLTGHPAIVIPTDFRQRDSGGLIPITETLTGHLFDEARLVAVAHQVQQRLTAWQQHPNLEIEESAE